MQKPVLYSPGKKRSRAAPKTKDLRKHVTLESLKDGLQTKEIVALSRQSLATLLKDIGFKFRALVEKHCVAMMRSVFLKVYVDNFLSKSPRPVMFLDKTWICSKGNKGR
ncbi:hypothetical protein Trydic_g21579 [Trypoxylus dichotomus]